MPLNCGTSLALVLFYFIDLSYFGVHVCVKSGGVTNVSSIHPVGTMNFCAKFHGNLSNNYDFSVSNKRVGRLTAIQNLAASKAKNGWFS